MPIIGQKLRPKLRFLATRAVHDGHGLGLPAFRGYLPEARAYLAKDDDALPIPGDPSDISGSSEFFYGSRRDLDPFKLAWSWEGKIAAIRGPGNAICPLRSVEPPRRRSI